MGIPKARMEAQAQRAKAADLAARLGKLQAAAQVPASSFLPPLDAAAACKEDTEGRCRQ